MNTRRKAELRAGLFINLAVALVILAVMFFGQTFNFLSRGTPYRLLLPNAQGLMEGAKVLVSGVNAGEVRGFSIDERTGQVLVALSVASKFQNVIRTDSVASLSTQGVLGDKVVEISPGKPESPVVPPGGELHGVAQADMSQVVGRSHVLLDHLDQLILALNRIAQPLAEGAQAQRISRNAALSLANLARLTGKLDQSIEPRRLSHSLVELDGILSKINNGQGTLGALINDPGIYDDLKALTGGANQSRIVRNLTRSVIEKDEKNEEKRARQEAGTGPG